MQTGESMSNIEATEWAAHMNGVGMPARVSQHGGQWFVWARHVLFGSVQECQAAIGRHVVGK